MKLIFGAILSVALLSFAEAGEQSVSLRNKIRSSLESLLESQAQGIENCENKCDKAFNKFAYELSTQTSQQTFEFQACVIGCNQCQQDLNSSTDPGNCFNFCKNYDWSSKGLIKGVIEPDKACLGGCMINTCQVICMGGTTDASPTPQNQQFFYPNGGCSIKTAPYSQYLEYVPFNSPNSGQGGSNTIAQCCANALSLCGYVGNKQSTNYQVLLAKTADFCNGFAASGSAEDICAFYAVPRNCGSL